MKKYQIQNSIGNGNFSQVYKGILIPERTPCAIKILKQHHNIAVRQAQLLKKFKHPNIISIIDFEQTYNESRIVLQYMGINTLQLYEAHPNGLKQQQVKCILFQVALGLYCVHQNHIIHRDVKPQNILIDKRLAIVKIIDFGLAIQQNKVSTDYIATRWYRAPENLLGTKEYTCAIDVFSLGCVIVELYIGVPLFPGANNLDQIFKIFSILGYPTQSNWPKGYQKMIELGIIPHNNNQAQFSNLKSKLPSCNPLLFDLIQKMLQINPKSRISCLDILKHKYFQNIKTIIPPSVYKRFEDDILTNKSVNFKTFQPAKSIKPNHNQLIMKHSKINFNNNVSAKVKHNQSQHQSIIIEKPLSYRQQKCSSVHSIQIVPPINQISNEGKLISSSNSIQINNLSRKFSTPTLLTYNQQQEQNLKGSQISYMPFRQMRIQQSTNSFDGRINLRRSQMAIPPQITNSTVANELKEIKYSQIIQRNSQNNGLLVHNSMIQKKNAQNLPTYPIAQARSYPTLPNVQFVSQQPALNLHHNFHQTNSFLQSHNFKKFIQSQMNSSLINSHQQKKLLINNSYKQIGLDQSYRSPLQISNSNHYNAFLPQARQQHTETKHFKQDKKRIRNFPQLRNNQRPQFYHRQNFAFPNHNINKVQHILRKPEVIYRSPDLSNKQVFLSPNPRPIGNVSPNQMIRHRRLNAVNNPLQHFYSPPPRK